MATYKNWLRSNITDRKDSGIDLNVTLTKIDEWNLNTSWDKACENTVKLIADLNKPIYIGLSGGLDSDYVCTLFEEAGVEYTPVVIDTTGNKAELEYAQKFLDAWGRDYKAIKLEKKIIDVLTVYYDEILVKCSGYGHNSVAAYIVGEYVKQQGGIYVMAEHLIDELPNGGFRVAAKEWDYYNDLLLGEDNTHYFFNYTPEISSAMIREFPDYADVQRCKSEMYGISYRPKMQYQYNSTYDLTLAQLRRSKWLKHNPNFTFGSREDYLERLKIMGDK